MINVVHLSFATFADALEEAQRVATVYCTETRINRSASSWTVYISARAWEAINGPSTESDDASVHAFEVYCAKEEDARNYRTPYFADGVEQEASDYD